MRLALANLKGGTGKTTSGVYLACALSESGSTVLIDTDPQGSAVLWAESATDLPFSTVAVPNASVGRQVLLRLGLGGALIPVALGELYGVWRL